MERIGDMPAKREARFHHRADAEVDMLSVEAEGDLECRRSVYFTDQSPEFVIQVTNISNQTDDLEGRITGRYGHG